MSHPLDGAYLRITRATEHVAELEGLVSAYGQSELDGISVDIDPNTFHLTLDFAEQVASSPMISVVSGEVLYNLRAALDYLVFELAKLDSGGVEQDGTQFPIEDSVGHFTARRKTFLKGFSDEHVAVIEGYQPYKGVEWTRRFRNFSNPDKHRKPITRLGGATIETAHKFGPPGVFDRMPGRILRAKGPSGQDVHVDISVSGIIRIRDDGRELPLTETLQDFIGKITETLGVFNPEF